MGANAPRVWMYPSHFMLAPLSMTNVKYQLWRSIIPYTERLMDDLDYDEFSETCLMPFLFAKICILSLSLSFLFFCIFLHMVILNYDDCVRVWLVLQPIVLLTLLIYPVGLCLWP